MAVNGAKLAVILAAGLGSRLGDMGKAKPKGFIQLGQQPIIHESLQRLRLAGVERVIIVTGHLADDYKQLAREFNGFVQLIHNPLYADSGSMYSLALAKGSIEEDFLLLESDIIYQQAALNAVQDYAAESVVLLSDTTDAGDEVYVQTRQQKSQQYLITMSKNLTDLGGDAAGELVGISRVSLGLYAEMLVSANKAFSTSLQVDYETDTLVDVAAERPVSCFRMDGLVWSEIDDVSHLKRAHAVVYPRIVSIDGEFPG